MTNDIGRSGVAVGLSSDDGAASVSALRASIPNAVGWCETCNVPSGVGACTSCRQLAWGAIMKAQLPAGPPKVDTESFYLALSVGMGAAAEIVRREHGQLYARCIIQYIAEFDRKRAAQGTPTRSAETTGSVGEADGGPVAKPCAQGDGQ